MRTSLIAATVLTLTTIASVQLAAAAATVPDNQARVNTLSAHAGNTMRNANAAIGDASQVVAPARVPFYETPARR